MRRAVNIIGGLLGLLVLGALAVALALTFGGLQKEAKPASQVFQSPIETPTQPPYPLPATPTIPPTVTRSPKPSPSPSPIPTTTPIPTPLPLPPSAFYALWVENFPEGEGSVLWLADPRDIGSRREILRFERDTLVEAALSPNGRKLALITTYWKTSTLWVANVDGSDLRQLDQGSGVGGPLLWSRDSRLLTYSMSWREEVMMPSYKTGTPGPVTVYGGVVELVDVTTSGKKQLLEIEPETSLSVLGWSADGQELYYAQSVLRENAREYELWAVDKSGRQAHKVALIGREPVPLILSPDGSKFLIPTTEGWSLMPANGQTRQNIPLPPWKQRCGLIWSPNADEIVLCEVDQQRPLEYIKLLSLHTGVTRILGSIEVSPRGLPFSPIAISPDMQWITASVYQTGMYWLHLPTGMAVPVPEPDKGTVFHIAWMTKPTDW